MEWLTKILKTAKHETLKEVFTSIPAKVLKFNAEKQTVDAQILIQTKTFDDKDLTIPEIVNVPVFQHGDKSFFIETQIEEGTEGALFFSHRCFKKWTDTGNIANQDVVRIQNISDCYFLAGIRSKPNVIGNHLNDGIRIRDKEADNFFHFKKDGSIHIKAKSIFYEVEDKITINGNTEQTGDIKAKNLTGTDEVTVSGKGLKDHIHGAGTYEVPNAGLVTNKSGKMA